MKTWVKRRRRWQWRKRRKWRWGGRVVRDLWQGVCSGPCTAPRYTSPNLGGQRRKPLNTTEMGSSTLCLERFWVQGGVGWSHCRSDLKWSHLPGSRGWPPALFPYVWLQGQPWRVLNDRNCMCGWYKQGEWRTYLRLIIQAGLAAAWRVIHTKSKGQALVQVLRNGPDWTHLGNQ